MDNSDWQTKFPNMQPVSGAPPLFRINGIGLGIYGKRAYDAETQTYVKTYCVSLFFIPVLALCAYRVIPAGGRRWRFIGRVGLSTFARAYNSLLLLALILVCWRQHLQSPDYLAIQRVAEAKSQEDQGNALGAARLYSEVAGGQTTSATNAAEHLGQIIEKQIESMPPAEIRALLKLAGLASAASKARALQAGIARVKLLETSHAADALLLLDSLTTLGNNSKSTAELRETLLQKIVEQEPTDIVHASELAMLYESRKEFEKCVALLSPLEARLGCSEGARILGQQYLRLEQDDAAFRLLSPYADSRLARFHDAEKALHAGMQTAWNSYVAELRAGSAPRSFYERVDKLPKDEKKKQIDEYIKERIKGDASVQSLQAVLAKESAIVPVALDLGILHLRRAQSTTDASTRKQELESAEKLFTEIQRSAGETDQYRLFYGQVLYWLGRQDDGRKLFDELLASKGRSSDMLIAVGKIYKQLGDNAGARTLFEEGYNQELNEKKKFELAHQRSCVFADLNDQIKWLQRSDPNDLVAAASLEVALGHKALREGDKISAAGHFRTGLNQNAKMLRTSTSLNNGSLAASELYEITHDRADLQRAVDMLEVAAQLEPNNTVLLFNLSTLLLEAAALDTIGNAIDFRTLDLKIDVELLDTLYTDEASRVVCMQRLVAQPSYQKATAILERLSVLAPARKPEIYTAMFHWNDRVRDVGKLKALLDRLNSSEQSHDNFARTSNSYQSKHKNIFVHDSRAHREQLGKLLASNPSDKHIQALGSIELIKFPGEYPDLDRAVTLAEHAYAAELSSYTCEYLVDTLTLRCVHALSNDNQLFSALCVAYQKSLGSRLVLAYAALKDKALCATLLRHPDFQRLLVVLRERGQRFPERREEWEWPLFNLTTPDEANAIAASINSDLAQTARAIASKLNPLDAHAAMSMYIAAIAAGKADEGRHYLEACANLGVPIPMVPYGRNKEK